MIEDAVSALSRYFLFASLSFVNVITFRDVNSVLGGELEMALNIESSQIFAEKLRLFRLGLSADEKASLDAMIGVLEKEAQLAGNQEVGGVVAELNERLAALPTDRSDDDESTWITVTTMTTATATSRWLCD